jgi:UDP-3-O-[3-hydroxymyristoyl] N-acetylglucosamine deacetylase
LTDSVTFSGVGLHSGQRTSLSLLRIAGPLTLVIDGQPATLRELELARADHGVAVRRRGASAELDLVEHLFAAFAGLSVRSGVAVEVTGPEVPLLDGGAFELGQAISMLRPPRQPAELVIERAGEIRCGEARYLFEPGPDTLVEVEIEFERGRIGRQTASFDGNPKRFLSEIAPARTFGFKDDAELLRARGRARHVDLSSVIVLEESGETLGPGPPPLRNELARHKLLDLLGDLFFHGGPPRGRLFAHRPGHGRTHAALRDALDQGLLVRG